MAVIRFENVSKRFGRQLVLRDLSFSVYPGETLVLIGESGCGKSVTLKLMLSLLQPTSGTVYWGEDPVGRLSPREVQRRRLQFGFLFQNAALFDSMTVYDNVAFGLRENTTLPEHRIREIVLERLQEVGLGPSVCQKKPAQLSGGMRKRVGLARALALSPKVMLYDEPTTGLDPIMSDVINTLIVQTRKRQPVTSVVVTHDMTTVRKVADRVIMLYPLSRLTPDEPQIVFEGTPRDLFTATDPRVSQFVRGEARDRLQEAA